MSGRTFDWQGRFDPRSRRYNIADVTPPLPRSYTWRVATCLDQGYEGACVGFGWAHELAARPAVVPGVTDDAARVLYHEAQQLDDDPGDDYEGTSVLAGAKAVSARGYVGEYRWAFSFYDLLGAIGHHGPAVLGLDWYTGMIAPADGQVWPTGLIEGGHCILATGVSFKRRLVRLHNSWGRSWGIAGDCVIDFDDLATLLDSGGEACVPVHRVAKAWTP